MALFRRIAVFFFVFLTINFSFGESELLKLLEQKGATPNSSVTPNSLMQKDFLEGSAWEATGSISQEEQRIYLEKGIDWNPKNPEYSQKQLLNAQDSSDFNNGIIMLIIVLAIGFYLVLIARMQRNEAS